jgi:hypothetical protein
MRKSAHVLSWWRRTLTLSQALKLRHIFPRSTQLRRRMDVSSIRDRERCNGHELLRLGENTRHFILNAILGSWEVGWGGDFDGKVYAWAMTTCICLYKISPRSENYKQNLPTNLLLVNFLRIFHLLISSNVNVIRMLAVFALFPETELE